MNDQHWDEVYTRKASDEVSWYRPHLDQSLKLIDEAGLSPEAAIIDVGAGASTLVDDLLDRGYRRLSMLDLSERALDVAMTRLGQRSGAVQWLVGDVTTLPLPEATFDLWHDRAVFHFLTDPLLRARYVEVVRRALKPGGRVIVATFSHEGPTTCSGLEVARYEEGEVHAVFGDDFAPLRCLPELHHTPSGKPQAFLYCECRLRQ
ncbi:MAG: class I SAM-dependent methyltransferase [Myxococcaceae bacterium]